MLPDPPRLMIVDDDPVTCEMLCEVFAAEGFASRRAPGRRRERHSHEDTL